MNMFCFALCASALVVAITAVKSNAGDATQWRIRHEKLADLGGEHVAHAVFRRTPDGGTIVAWGERIVEWPLSRPTLRQTVAPQGNLQFSNGGCALDVDGDGTDEIVVARGKTRSCADAELFWFEQSSDATSPWTAMEFWS